MALIPESVVHQEIRENLLRIGWEDGNEKLKIEEHKMIGKYNELEDFFGEFVVWDILKKKIRELNSSLFVNLTGKQEEQVWKEIRSSLERANEVQLLNYIKYGIPIVVSDYGDNADQTARNFRVIIIDYNDPSNNIFFFLHEAKFPGVPDNIKPDFTLFINGVPIVIIEAKAKGIIDLDEVDWRRWSKVSGTEEEALIQIRRYEAYSKPLFRFVQFGVAYGDKQLYTPTMPGKFENAPAFEWRFPDENQSNIFDLLTPSRLLDVLKYYTFFFRKSEGKARRIKVIARWNQYRATKKIIERIEEYLSLKDDKKKGLVWQWQGSGKTFIMFFVANWFLNRYREQGKKPVVFFVVDRTDLKNQHLGVLKAVEDYGFKIHLIRNIPELKDHISEIMKSEKSEGVIPTGLYITTIQKFQPKRFKDMLVVKKDGKKKTFKAMKAVEKTEVLFLIDEAHRTQYGYLAAAMKALFPRAMFFGFTGTPIFKQDRNTFQEFAYPERGEYFLDVYFIRDSIRDGFTLDIIHEVIEEEEVRLNLTEERLKAFLEAYQLNDPEDVEAFLMGKKKNLKISSKELARELHESRMFLENPKAIERFAEYIAKRIYEDTMEFNFKAMVVAVNRKACVHFKRSLDKAFKRHFCSKAKELSREGKEELAKKFQEFCENAERLSEVVMTYQHNEKSDIIKDFKKQLKSRREFQKKDYDRINKTIIEWFQEKEYPKVLIVTDMLLTGFDAPILRVMYLYKPIFEHRLLQAIARVNRPYPNKETGLIVDGVGLLSALIKVRDVYEMIAKQDPRVIEDFKRNFVRSVEDKVKEFEVDLQEVKRELLDIGIDIEVLKSLRAQGQWKDLEKEMKKVQTTLAPIALDFKGKEPKAVNFFNHLRSVVSGYRALGAHPAKLQYFDDMMIIGMVYSTFIRLIGFTAGRKSKFWDDLLNFVYQHMEIGPMREVTKIKLGEFPEDEVGVKTVTEVNWLHKLAEDNAHDPVYKAILKRLNHLIEEWINRNVNLKMLNKQIEILKRQINEYEKQRAGKSWQDSLLESIRFYAKTEMGIENVEFKKFRDELRRIKKKITPRVIKRLSSALFDDLAMSLNEEDPKKYRELSREIDKLIEDSIVPEILRHTKASRSDS